MARRARGSLPAGRTWPPPIAWEGGKAGEVESGAIATLLGSVRGVKKIHGAGPTEGAADQDDERYLRRLAPTRARAFGRAVSAEDLVDLALGYPGVTHAAVWTGAGPPGCACGRSGLHLAFIRSGATAPRPPLADEITALAGYLDARRDATVPLCVCAGIVTRPRLSGRARRRPEARDQAMSSPPSCGPSSTRTAISAPASARSASRSTARTSSRSSIGSSASSAWRASTFREPTGEARPARRPPLRAARTIDRSRRHAERPREPCRRLAAPCDARRADGRRRRPAPARPAARRRRSSRSRCSKPTSTSSGTTSSSRAAPTGRCRTSGRSSGCRRTPSGSRWRTRSRCAGARGRRPRSRTSPRWSPG